MEKLFMVVTSKEVDVKNYMGNSTKEQTKIDMCVDADETTRFIGKIATDPKDPRRIERVFSVDEFGGVVWYDVRFEGGKLKVVQRPTFNKHEQEDVI